MKRTVESSTPRDGIPEINLTNPDENPDNVKRVSRIITQEIWKFLFPRRNGVYTYVEFLKAIWKYPTFCNESADPNISLDDMCKKELATMFAHFAQETGMNDGSQSIPIWRQALFYINEIGCTDANPCQYFDWYNDYFKVSTGVSYHGRGAKQLSWNYNYGAYSLSAFGDSSVLLNAPERIAKEGWLALGSALWFYMNPQPPKPSIHDVVTGFYKPNTVDLNSKNPVSFGTTTNIINGAQECGWISPASVARGENYKNLMEYFKLDAGDKKLFTCENSQAFNAGGWGSIPFYLYKDWNDESKCQLVEWWTGFPSNLKNAYQLCVNFFNPNSTTDGTNTDTGGGTIPGSTTGYVSMNRTHTFYIQLTVDYYDNTNIYKLIPTEYIFNFKNWRRRN